MSKKLTYLFSFVLVLGLAVGVANATPLQQDPGPDGIVSVEAEHYDNKAPGQNGTGWEEVGTKGGFTGVAGMEVFDESMNATTYVEESARLDYEIDFVKTGTHYVWILAYGPDGGSDSCHAGLDGEGIPSLFCLLGWNGDYEWNSDRVDSSEPPTFEITTTGVHTFNVWMREDNLIVDKIVLTTNSNFTLTGTEPGPPESARAAEIIAFDPIPADGAIDVPRDIVLSWIAGAFADKHDVYFGTNFDDVNQADRTNSLNVLVSQGQNATTYDPGRLEFSQSYYWRIDEVDAPPDSTIHKGGTWQFTVEPFVYPIAGTSITATASSSDVSKGPENTVNGSGLDDSGLLHGNISVDSMWLSDITGPQPTWIEYEFDRVYRLSEMWVWNSNDSLEPMIGVGLKGVTIEHSTNGIDYTTLGTTHEFAQATGAADYAHDTTVDLSGVAAKYVKLTANSNWGGIFSQYGLSEVRFFYIPVHAREPNPDSGATDVDVDVVLSFRAGREAAQHDAYFSSDQQAVIDGTSPVVTIDETSYGPLALDLDVIYYWKINEVNEAGTPTTLDGDVWNFTTRKFLVVDDFESYNDLNPDDPESNRIFLTWIDGYEVPTNGSLVGYDAVPFAEQTIVHGGKQSMPLAYSNTGGATYSETERTFAAAQNWTKAGATTLVLYFYGTEGNTGQLYVKVNGTKVAYDGDAGDIAKPQWTQWNIDLASLGVDLQNVTKLAIGIDGNGASGTLYVDDIRLYPAPPPEPEPQP